MRYGKAQYASIYKLCPPHEKTFVVWHMMPGGTPLCGTKAKIIETADALPEGVKPCRNCDDRLRYRGKELAKREAKKVDRRVLYSPRNKFREEP